MRASLGCWQRKCSLTFDRKVLDLSWMCCDAHAVCSFWLIAPLIKALSPADPYRAFTSPYLISRCPLLFLLSSPLSSPLFLHITSRLHLLTYSAFPPSLPVCLHSLLSSLFPSSLPAVLISGGNHPGPPPEIQSLVCGIVNQVAQKADSSVNCATCKQLTESDAAYRQAASNTKHRSEDVRWSVVTRDCVNVSGLRVNKVWRVASRKPVCHLLRLSAGTLLKFI